MRCGESTDTHQVSVLLKFNSCSCFESYSYRQFLLLSSAGQMKTATSIETEGNSFVEWIGSFEGRAQSNSAVAQHQRVSKFSSPY